MAATLTLRSAMKQSLQAKESSTMVSLGDLERAYFSSTPSSRNDGIRAFLQSQTGLTAVQSLGDLWRQYFLGKGIQNKVSLTDMANDYFTTQTLP